jgi:hypothetical protein
MASVIHQQGGIHVVLNARLISISKTDESYPKVVKAIQAGASDSVILELLETESRLMQEAVTVAPGITLQSGQLLFENEPIGGVLGARMLLMHEEGFDLGHMSKFLANLRNNPSEWVVEHLYPSLEKGKNAITEDGHFLAFKIVKSDWTDGHSGKFYNKVGTILSMPRLTTEDPYRTCSFGFHVCSFDSLPTFARTSGRVIVCKVNPADVFALPLDCSGTNLRVSRYEVIGENEGYFDKPENSRGFSRVRVGDSTKPFVVEICAQGFDDFEAQSAHASLLTAAEAMRDFADNTLETGITIRLVNSISGTVLDTLHIQATDPLEVVGSGNTGHALFTVYGRELGVWRQAGEFGHDSLTDAVMAALELPEPYESIQIRGPQGDVLRTITS